MSLILIQQEQQEITKTNYFESEFCALGYMFLSMNAGAFRLLLPTQLHGFIEEMSQAKYVIVSKGYIEAGDCSGYELIFEDESTSPLSLITASEMTDRDVPNSDHGKEFTFALYTQSGKIFELPCKFRIVKDLPCSERWENIGSTN